jgi:hypothetical protein
VFVQQKISSDEQKTETNQHAASYQKVKVKIDGIYILEVNVCSKVDQPWA